MANRPEHGVHPGVIELLVHSTAELRVLSSMRKPHSRCDWLSVAELHRLFPVNRQIGPLDNDSSPEDKIALFRSLFRGRDDVYPRRFESRRTGKSGYQPACANEWVRDVCEKPRVKCAECPHRRFLPVTDDVVRWHLSGQGDDGRDFVMGVYPMLLDETCFFLAVDFDKAHWREDVAAFLETCRATDLPVTLERSRSGNGGHVWFFFDEAIPAGLARKLGSHILTETMDRRPEIGLDSYDRFFPNQDTLPKGGFGNLIALPLQRQPRQCGNTVFLDDQLAPYADQWVVLSQIRKIARRQVEEVVHRAEGRGRVVGVRLALPDDSDATPWTAPPSRRRKDAPISEPLPASLELVLGDGIYIAKDTMPPVLRNRLLRLAAFQNPEFYKAQAMRLPTYDKPRIIACAEDHSHHVSLPRNLPRLAGTARSAVRLRGPQVPVSDSVMKRRAIGFEPTTSSFGAGSCKPRCWPREGGSDDKKPPGVTSRGLP